MAKIHEEIVVIKLSKLVRDDATVDTMATDDIVAALQSVAEELAGAGVVVEMLGNRHEADEDSNINEHAVHKTDARGTKRCRPVCILKFLQSALTLDMFDAEGDAGRYSTIDRLAVVMFYVYGGFAIFATLHIVALPTRGTGFSLGEHSVFFGLCFHFMFIVSSYAIKGLRHEHSGYTLFSSLSALAFALVAFSAGLAALTSSDIAAFLVYSMVGAGAATLGANMHVHWCHTHEAWHEAGEKNTILPPPTFLV